MKLFKNWSKTQKNGCWILALLITLSDLPRYGSFVLFVPFFITLIFAFIQFAGIYIMFFLIITLYNDLKKGKISKKIIK